MNSISRQRIRRVLESARPRRIPSFLTVEDEASMSQIEIEETIETIEVIMLEKLIALAKQVGRLELENEVLIGDSGDDVSGDEDDDEVIIDCANMTLRDLIELEFTDEQLVDIIAETRAELADDCD